MMEFSRRDSQKLLSFQRFQKLEGYHPSDTITYRYSHFGIEKSYTVVAVAETIIKHIVILHSIMPQSLSLPHIRLSLRF